LATRVCDVAGFNDWADDYQIPIWPAACGEENFDDYPQLTVGMFRRLIQISDMAQVQEDVHAWSAATFPKQTLASVVTHLHAEVDELHAAVASAEVGRWRRMKEELADCAILVLGMAERVGVDLHRAVLEKLAIKQGPDLDRQRGGLPRARQGEVP
jgi:NTP pyrophosphatase (non-canonical NTP hydrolase)